MKELMSSLKRNWIPLQVPKFLQNRNCQNFKVNLVTLKTSQTNLQLFSFHWNLTLMMKSTLRKMIPCMLAMHTLTVFHLTLQRLHVKILPEQWQKRFMIHFNFILWFFLLIVFFSKKIIKILKICLSLAQYTISLPRKNKMISKAHPSKYLFQTTFENWKFKNILLKSFKTKLWWFLNQHSALLYILNCILFLTYLRNFEMFFFFSL